MFFFWFITATTYGSSVTYECDSGYLMLGNASATCLESKTWSSDPPICECELDMYALDIVNVHPQAWMAVLN